jgi:hypothetical protein
MFLVQFSATSCLADFLLLSEQPFIFVPYSCHAANSLLQCSHSADSQRKTLMKKLFIVALFASTIAGFGAANAMSPAPVAPASGDVIHVAGGCGAGFHRDRYGRCRVNRYVRPAPVVRRCRYWAPGRRVCRTWW